MPNDPLSIVLCSAAAGLFVAGSMAAASLLGRWEARWVDSWTGD